MGRTPPGKTRERIYRFLRERLLAGRPPTVREVQTRFGFSAVQSAREHLERLVDEGRLEKEPGKSRGYRLPARERPGPIRLVPVLGQIQAGALDLAVEDLEGYVPVHTKTGEKDLFGLRVRGESMTGAGILPGDLVLVRKQKTARSGQIVVALVEDEATVKTFQKKRGRIELHPQNPRYRPIVPDPQRFSLLGKVVEVRRYL